MAIFVNKITTYRYVVAVCDSDLLGKVFEEGQLQLDAKESFFKGEEKPEEEVIAIMQDMKKEDATFNIIGKESIEAAKKAGIATDENVNEIQGIPYTLVLL